MSIINNSTRELPTGTLSLQEAATHIRFKPRSLALWRRRGLLLPTDPISNGWTVEQLRHTLDTLAREGHAPSIAAHKKHQYFQLPNVHRPRKKVTEGGYNEYKYYCYFRPTREFLGGSPGSPAFMTALIDCERRYAAKQRAAAPTPNSSPSAPAGTTTASAGDQCRTPLEPSAHASVTAQKFVTQNPAAETTSERPRTPADLASRMRRRRAAVTQAEIARIIRAAKQAGASEIELRLNDSSSAIVRLQPGAVLESDEDIIL